MNKEETFGDDTLFGIINIYDEDEPELEIFVETTNINIPHFDVHITFNGKTDICHIKFLSAEYLRCDNNDTYILTEDQCERLDWYLKMDVPGSKYYKHSNWEAALIDWNELNPNNKVDIEKYSCPDYTKLKETE